MSATVTYTLWCEGVGCVVWQYAERARSATEARRALRAAGWVRRRVDGDLVDLCPECARPGRCDDCGKIFAGAGRYARRDAHRFRCPSAPQQTARPGTPRQNSASPNAH